MSGETNGKFVGIDLGTTQSVVAYLDSTGAPATIPNRDGDPLTRSAIYLDGAQAVVGKTAKKMVSHFAERVATLVKRSMGERLYDRLVNGRHFFPETLSAVILRKLKQDAERRIGPISAAVITVPAFFDDTRRKATEDAGRIAGLDVLDIINEPTAAAIAYTFEGRLGEAGATPTYFPGGEQTVLVYDLGGGTFDVTIVDLSSNHFHAVATDGAVELGGKDWDERIVDYLGEEFARQHGFNPLLGEDGSRNPDARLAAASSAEAAKELLSEVDVAPLEYVHRGRELSMTLHHDKFVELTRDLLKHTQILTNHVREQAQLSWNDIDRVLLVGGSTRMPMVKTMLRNLTGSEADDRLDPDQVVARGAAIFAAIRASNDDRFALQLDDRLTRELHDVQVRNVNSHSLGIRAYQQRRRKWINKVLIAKNSTLPCARSHLFPIGKAGLITLKLTVLEGDAKEASACIPIGECVVSGLPANLSAKSPIQVQLRYDDNGRVSVSALEPTQGVFARAELEREVGLTEEEIRREAEFVQSLTIQ
ncbi:MAG: Hsp70 family protein [Pirellulaceae bacterium]